MISIAFAFFISIMMVGASSGRAASLPDSCAKDANGKYASDVEIPCKALDNFLEAFNSGDELRWAKTLNYPHVRMSGGVVSTWNKPEEYAKDQDTSKLAAATGWKETKWDYRYVVQAGNDGKTGSQKYHVALSFTRYDNNDKSIPGQTFDSFYIITNQNGHWGTQFRSSMAGSLHGRSAY